MIMMQLLSIVGAGAILGAYAGHQLGWTGTTELSYQITNLLGALLLLIVATVEFQIGFILLETAWAGVSVWGIANILRGDGGRR